MPLPTAFSSATTQSGGMFRPETIPVSFYLVGGGGGTVSLNEQYGWLSAGGGGGVVNSGVINIQEATPLVSVIGAGGSPGSSGGYTFFIYQNYTVYGGQGGQGFSAGQSFYSGGNYASAYWSGFSGYGAYSYLAGGGGGAGGSGGNAGLYTTPGSGGASVAENLTGQNYTLGSGGYGGGFVYDFANGVSFYYGSSTTSSLGAGAHGQASSVQTSTNGNPGGIILSWPTAMHPYLPQTNALMISASGTNGSNSWALITASGTLVF